MNVSYFIVSNRLAPSSKQRGRVHSRCVYVRTVLYSFSDILRVDDVYTPSPISNSPINLPSPTFYFSEDINALTLQALDSRQEGNELGLDFPEF